MVRKTRLINLKEVQSKIFKYINRSKNRKELLIIMQKAFYEVRLFCWKVLTEEIINDDTLIDKAIADFAPGIRQWAAAHLPDNQNYKNRISILLNDSAIRVRYTALRNIPKLAIGEHFYRVFPIKCVKFSKGLDSFFKFY
ncbi:hypothetical protein RHORCCE3_1640 [Rickettsia hoogstraalii str. RCCE3]|nr:hypothetical protein RHORCCE3_1640 [Rickettsia hoogstraalii str. RCCE3]